MTTTTPEVLNREHSMVWTPEGRQTFINMARHVETLAAAYGQEHRWAREAASSFAKITVSLFGFESLRVMKDGDLSLICTTGGSYSLVFGLIFHQVRRSCVNDDCSAYRNDDGHVWWYQRTDEIRPDCGLHSWNYPLNAPTPGTWSFHS